MVVYFPVALKQFKILECLSVRGDKMIWVASDKQQTEKTIISDFRVVNKVNWLISTPDVVLASQRLHASVS